MYTRQHNLTVPGLHNAAHFLQDIFFPAAPDPAPGIRDDAVGTKLVTAVLNLNISPRMPASLSQHHFFILIGMVDIYDIHGGLPFLQIFFQNGDNFFLTVIADGQVNGFILPDRLFPGLYITAHRHHHCLWVTPPGTVQHLPAFPVCNIGYRTRIYNIDIGCFIKWYNFVSLFL